ncbi:MAG: four helix bundle protein [Pirellulales bacterium]|nr:four helix bundle protein [Pirellulales bacterium]
MAIRDYRQLMVWQKAMDLVETVYRTTRTFPKEELYGLTIQIRRAAVSVPSNIAEGQGRHTTRDFLHFLAIAHGSLKELETQILIAHRLNYMDQQEQAQLTSLTHEVGRLISGLVRSLMKRATAPPRPNH